MKVDIWAEVTCPWCGLATHRVKRAVERFEHAAQVEVVHHSFPLGSGFPEGHTFSVREAMRQNGIGGGQAEEVTRQIEMLAESEGLSPYRVLDNEVGNTDLAHEFLAHASTAGKNREAWDAIFRAHFGRAESVFSREDLLKLGDELGLDREPARQALDDRRYRQQVQDDARLARDRGARGAPFILIDGRYDVSGAQGSDTLLKILRTAWDDTDRLTADAGDAPVCGPDSCAAPA